MTVTTPSSKFFQTLPERYEMINGVIYDMTPLPLEIHQRIVINLLGELIPYVKGKSCNVYTAPFGMWWDETSDEHVEPDVVVVCDPSKIHEKGCVGAPDLIVEVLSRSTAGKDRGVKLKKYRSSGVKEYWIIDPVNELVEVYSFDDNLFREPSVYEMGVVDDEGTDEKHTLISSGVFEDLKIEIRQLFL